MIPTGPWNAFGVHTVPTASTTDLTLLSALGTPEPPNTTFTLLPAKLAQAETVIAIQKKVASLLGIPLKSSDKEEND